MGDPRDDQTPRARAAADAELADQDKVADAADLAVHEALDDEAAARDSAGS